MDNQLKALKSGLREAIDPEKAEFLPKFFKAFPGGYGEGDKFLGVTVPNTRKVARQYRELSLTTLSQLLSSPWHEERLCALVILSLQFQKADPLAQEKIYRFVVKHKKYINNWDLVDLVCPKVVGPYLYTHDRDVLYQWVKSKSLWIRRMSIMSTYCFIKQKDFDDTLNLAELLLDDKEDLIHKAAGWMLREVGNQSLAKERAFLRKFAKNMPRTMLRYAIEKMDQKERQKWLKV